MKIEKIALRKLARLEIWKSILMIIPILMFSSLLGAAGIFVMVGGVIFGNIYIFSRITNFPCPNCSKPYGLGANAFDVFNITVPDNCVCCHAHAE